MVVGIILANILLLLWSKYVTKRAKNKKLDKLNNRLHKAMGIIFIVLIVIHFIMVLSLFKQRPHSIYILGIIMIIMAVGSLFSYYLRKCLGRKWLIVHRIFAISMMFCMVIHVTLCIMSLREYKNKVENIVIDNVDVTQIKDGDYVGESDVGYIYAKVKVSVKKGKIEKIKLLEHRTERGKPAEVVVDQIVEKQQVNVDTVTSATNSSKVIMKAVENALKSEQK